MEPSLPPELLSQILRWSIHAHSSNSISTTTEGFGKNPASRKLIEQILFTRRFVPSYLAVLGIVVFVFSVAHWFPNFRRWRRSGNYSRGKVAADTNTGTESPTSSSGSSTLQGTPSSSGKTSPKPGLEIEVNEATRLLAKDDLPIPTRSNTSILRRLRCHLLSTLSYQPSPTSALTSPINSLPQNGTSLLILIFFGLNLFYLFFHTPLSIPMLFVFADRAGLLFVANLPVLYILAAKTNQPLKFLTGWSYEGLNIFHRRLGEWMIVLAVMHGLGMFGVWYTLLRPLDFTLWRFISTRLVLLGMGALSCYLAIWGTSIGWVRKLWYETFLGLHIVLQVAALVILFFHHPGARVYVLVSVGIWTLDRLLGRILLGSKRFVATLQITEDSETVLLFADIPVHPGHVGTKLNIAHGWKAGQHVFLTVPGINWTHRLQTHPFTIASPAPPPHHSGTWPLQLTIRAQSGFSRQLLEYAKLHQHTPILLDGPYGSLDALDALQSADRTCLIAGGSGIAVTYPLAWSLVVKDEADSIVSTRPIYRDGRREEIFLRNHWSAREFVSGKMAHLWIYQHWNHDKWITMHPRLERVRSTPVYVEGAIGGYEQENGSGSAWPENMREVADLRPKSFSTRDTVEGRPDVGLELRGWVEGESGERTRKEKKHERICIVVSGPDSLVRDVRNTAAALLREGWNVVVHVEKFGW